MKITCRMLEVSDRYSPIFRRLSLPEPYWTGDIGGETHFTGVYITGLWYGPVSRRCIRRTFSLWDDGHGGRTGTMYEERTTSDFLRDCETIRVQPPDAIAADGLDDLPPKKTAPSWRERIIRAFPGFVSDQPVNGADLVDFIGQLINHT